MIWILLGAAKLLCRIPALFGTVFGTTLFGVALFGAVSLLGVAFSFILPPLVRVPRLSIARRMKFGVRL
jgi:hypothetical protein